MRFNLTINNVKAQEFGLNVQQAYLFAWIYELPSWAKSVTLKDQQWYFASRFKAIEELPLLTDKPDTMYRYYKQLEELGLIMLTKIVNKDHILLTKKAKQWNDSRYTAVPHSEKALGLFSEHSEINPSQLGNISESNSEIFPTYNNTSIYNYTNNNILYIENDFFEKICFDFDQTLDPLKKSVCEFLEAAAESGQLQNFKKQTEAYLSFKKITKQPLHRWISFTAEWNSDDWISKLKKVNKNATNRTSAAKNNYTNYD